MELISVPIFVLILYGLGYTIDAIIDISYSVILALCASIAFSLYFHENPGVRERFATFGYIAGIFIAPLSPSYLTLAPLILGLIYKGVEYWGVGYDVTPEYAATILGCASLLCITIVGYTIFGWTANFYIGNFLVIGSIGALRALYYITDHNISVGLLLLMVTPLMGIISWTIDAIYGLSVLCFLGFFLVYEWTRYQRHLQQIQQHFAGLMR